MKITLDVDLSIAEPHGETDLGEQDLLDMESYRVGGMVLCPNHKHVALFATANPLDAESLPCVLRSVREFATRLEQTIISDLIKMSLDGNGEEWKRK